MGDGSQVRQSNSTEYSAVQRVSATRAWRCLLLLGATGVLVVACSKFTNIRIPGTYIHLLPGIDMPRNIYQVDTYYVRVQQWIE